MTSTLHVAVYHPSVLPVTRYGGTERVVVWLARGLAELGHRVTVLALAGTRLAEAQVVTVAERDAFQAGGARLDRYLPPGVDVVHAHVPLAEPPTDLPFWWTFHGTGKLGRRFSDRTIALSADHARRHGIARWVHNGLDPSEYQFTAGRGAYDLYLGRLHSAKGWRWARNGARQAGRPIILAGGWRPSLKRGVHFAGRVGGARKAALLAGAGALWMPARWDEPFGLTTIEAMVSGVPVLGTHRGALPEIITEASGRMGDTLADLVALRSELNRLDPDAIRANVLERFTHRMMAERYLAIYRGDENMATRD